MTAELAISNPATLFKIADDLGAYTETLAYIEAQLAEAQTDEDRQAFTVQRAEVQASIAAIGKELAAKTDAVAAVLRRLSAEKDFAHDERDRLKSKELAIERAIQWLRGYVVNTMQEQGLKQLKTPTNTLFIRASEAVEITDASKIPATYFNAEVKLPLVLWREVIDYAKTFGPPTMASNLEAVRISAEPSLSTIKKAIKSGIDIPGADVKLNSSLVCR